MLQVAPEIRVSPRAPSHTRRLALVMLASIAMLGVAVITAAFVASSATTPRTVRAVTIAGRAIDAAVALGADREQTLLAVHARSGATTSLAASRTAADTALAALAALDLPAAMRERLTRAQTQLEHARERADGAIAAHREVDTATWFDDVSDAIAAVADVRRAAFAASDIDAAAVHVAAVQEAAFLASEYAARERARIGAALAGRHRLTPRDLRRLDGERALGDLGFAQLRVILPAPALDLDRDYRLQRDGVLESERYGTLPAARAATFVADGGHAVRAVDDTARASLREFSVGLAARANAQAWLESGFLAAFVSLAVFLGLSMRRAPAATLAPPVRVEVRPVRAFVVIEGGRRAR